MISQPAFQKPQARFAVLIDGDNISAKHAKELFNAISRLGRTIVCRVFGAWKKESAPAWKRKWLEQFGLEVVETDIGDNATDMTMTIAAVDLLHEGVVDNFILVTNDADFAPLVNRLHKSGLPVYGFGLPHAAKILKRAYDSFFELSGFRKKKAPLASDTTLVARLNRAIELFMNKHGWAKLTAVGAYLTRTSADYAKNKYGHATLTKLLESTGSFVVEQTTGAPARVRKLPAQEIPCAG